jgi:hypothetical protein
MIFSTPTHLRVGESRSVVQITYESITCSYLNIGLKRLQELLPEAYAMRAANPECGGMQDQLQAFDEAVGQAGNHRGSDALASM